MKSQLSPILPGAVAGFTAKTRRVSRVSTLGQASLLALAAYGLMGCTDAIDRPVDIATAPKTIVPYGGFCSGMTIRVVFKNGTTRPPFAVCAVTDTYVEPCYKNPNHAYNYPNPKPERLKFADMASIKGESRSTLARCWGNPRL